MFGMLDWPEQTMLRSGITPGTRTLTIGSKDAYFHHLSFVQRSAPKVICIRHGNCSTTDIAALLRSDREFLVDAWTRDGVSDDMLQRITTAAAEPNRRRELLGLKPDTGETGDNLPPGVM